MTNIVKRAISKTRDKLLAEVIKSISELDTKIVTFQQDQLDLYHELEGRIKNSGTIQLSPNEVMTKIFSGAKMYLDPHDIAVVPHLVLDGEWEHDVTHAWLSIVKENDIVIDIGANFGYF